LIQQTLNVLLFRAVNYPQSKRLGEVRRQETTIRSIRRIATVGSEEVYCFGRMLRITLSAPVMGAW
jgi:hypothetical protein